MLNYTKQVLVGGFLDTNSASYSMDWNNGFTWKNIDFSPSSNESDYLFSINDINYRINNGLAQYLNSESQWIAVPNSPIDLYYLNSFNGQLIAFGSVNGNINSNLYIYDGVNWDTKNIPFSPNIYFNCSYQYSPNDGILYVGASNYGSPYTGNALGRLYQFTLPNAWTQLGNDIEIISGGIVFSNPIYSICGILADPVQFYLGVYNTYANLSGGGGIYLWDGANITNVTSEHNPTLLTCPYVFIYNNTIYGIAKFLIIPGSNPVVQTWICKATATGNLNTVTLELLTQVPSTEIWTYTLTWAYVNGNILYFNDLLSNQLYSYNLDTQELILSKNLSATSLALCSSNGLSISTTAGITYYSDCSSTISISSPLIDNNSKMLYKGFFDEGNQILTKTKTSKSVIYCKDSSVLFDSINGYVSLTMSFPQDIINGVYTGITHDNNRKYLLWGTNVGDSGPVTPTINAMLTYKGIEFSINIANTNITIIDNVSNISANEEVYLEFAWLDQGIQESHPQTSPFATMLLRVNNKTTARISETLTNTSLKNTPFNIIDNSKSLYNLECSIKEIVVANIIPQIFYEETRQSSSSSMGYSSFSSFSSNSSNSSSSNSSQSSASSKSSPSSQSSRGFSTSSSSSLNDLFTYNPLGGGNAEITGYTGGSRSIRIPSSINGYTITGIANNAFLNNSNVLSATIPNTVTYIGNSAFQGCGISGTISIPASVTTIGASAFNAINTTTVNIYGTIISMGTNAFSSSNTINAYIYGGTIGTYAFQQCINLQTVTIGPAPTTIGDYAFNYCYALSSLTFGNTVNIGQDILFNNSNVVSLIIPDSVTSVGVKAFQNCFALQTIVIGGGITALPAAMFAGCSSLSNVTIGQNVTTMVGDYGGDGNATFGHCTSLLSIIIPASVTSMPNAPFYGSNNNMSFYFEGDAPTTSNIAFGLSNTHAYCHTDVITFGTVPNTFPSAWNSMATIAYY